ncbi:MAG TPA: helix-turn-helix domain-containing protein [Allosphingosinicella sp.]|nr:helix-turn-helix domain-containing protein [Allosphingosinicella sp.]
MQEGTFPAPGHPQVTAVPRGDTFAAACPARELLDRIAGKWSVLILLTLGTREMRFNGLRRRIEGISQKMLSQTLRALERDGMIARAVEDSMPVTVTYSITPLGRGLLSSLQSMIDWAETRMVDVAQAQRDYDALQRA